MKIKQFMTLALASSVLFTACSKDDDGGITPQGGEETYATLSLSEAASPITRAIGNAPDENGTANENEIKQIEVYIFDGTTGARKATLDYHKITAADITNNKARFALEDGPTHFLVAVNMDLGKLGTDSYNDVKKVIADYTLDETNSMTEPTTKGFPMSGKAQNVAITVNDPDNQVTIPVSRLLSKVNEPTLSNTFTVNLQPEDIEELWDDQLSGNIGFTLDGFVVINGLDKSDAFFTWNATDNEGGAWGDWIRTGKAYQKSTFEANGDLKLAYGGSSFKTNGTVYVNENDPLEYTSSTGLKSYKKDEVYAMLIKGTLKPADTNYPSEVRYWRINFYKDDNYRVYRNGIYNIEINSVISKGYGTAKEAEEDEDNGPDIPGNDQTGVLATIQVMPWRVFKQSGDM